MDAGSAMSTCRGACWRLARRTSCRRPRVAAMALPMVPVAPMRRIRMGGTLNAVVQPQRDGRPAAMDTIGLDLHKRESQLCELTEAGEIVERRIVTSRERFTAVLGGRPPARILVEASTESEWVARHLESLGHEVIVADPNFAPMYATRRRGVKTDRRDARTLAEACRLGAYRPAHRASDGQRHVRAQLAVRDALIRTRTRYIALTKALGRRDRVRLPSGTPAHTHAKLAALAVPPA